MSEEIIEVKINGEIYKTSESETLFNYLEKQGFNVEKIAVERDYEILSREFWDKVLLKDAKNYEIVEFVGGG
ncbi:MAG: sulfur carrier protein ThiS [Campylobacter sp.]|nr:sulfur carrier protein ThiS [Campylobacter sp.]